MTVEDKSLVLPSKASLTPYHDETMRALVAAKATGPDIVEYYKIREQAKNTGFVIKAGAGMGAAFGIGGAACLVGGAPVVAGLALIGFGVACRK